MRIAKIWCNGLYMVICWIEPFILTDVCWSIHKLDVIIPCDLVLTSTQHERINLFDFNKNTLSPSPWITQLSACIFDYFPASLLRMWKWLNVQGYNSIDWVGRNKMNCFSFQLNWGNISFRCFTNIGCIQWENKSLICTMHWTNMNFINLIHSFMQNN